jgi:hypothetical protein
LGTVPSGLFAQLRTALNLQTQDEENLPTLRWKAASLIWRNLTSATTRARQEAEELAISVKGKRLTYRTALQKSDPSSTGSEALSALGEASWQHGK